MIRRCSLLVGALLCALLMLCAAPARAQTITPDGLDNALLSTDASSLSGYTVVADNTMTNPDGSLTALRVFPRTTNSFEVAAVVLVANPDSSSLGIDLSQAAQSGALISALASNVAAGAGAGAVGDFTLLGPQGIGDSDQAAQFTLTVAGTPLQLAGDVWQHGNGIALAIYGGAQGTVDAPTALQQALAIAQQQDAKLSAQ